jgi:PKHD-type hydroxylase
MLLHIPEVLNADELAHGRRRLAQAPWGDGHGDSGNSPAVVGGHLRLPGNDAAAQELAALIETALARNTTFFAGALPRHVFPPLFSQYRVGQLSGSHVGHAVRYEGRHGADAPMRADLSAVLFLSDPDEYDGGELVIEDTYGAHTVKLAAGDMILYPASSVCRVDPVTRGARTTAFLGIQSLVRDEARRRLLLELDVSIQSLGQAHAPQADVLRLTGVYHNLLRTWSET